MSSKFIAGIRNYRILGLLLALSLTVVTGCQSGFLGEQNAPPAAASNQPQTTTQTAPMPIVVDGTRASYADVVEKTSPAVVRIESDIKTKQSPQQQMQGSPFDDFFNSPQMPNGGQQQQQQQRPQIERGLGSGVIVSADGYILTNNHVVEDADKITVMLSDNKTFVAKVVGLDKPSDLAVLKIEATTLPFLNLGNSDNVRVGDIVLAIGNPLGIGQSVTQGIISAKGRRTGLSDANGSFEDFLQTDAPINRGNSGGALVNLTGELIGINSQILSSGQQGGSIGIGFSIPSNMAKTVMEQLIQNGKVRRGMLGINIQNITEDVAKSLDLSDAKGVIVSNVRAGSAAEKAGIKRGDIVLAINGDAIEDSNVLRNKVAQAQPGSEIKIKIQRDGKEQEVSATLDEFSVDGAKPDDKSGNDNNNQNGGKQSDGGKLGLNLQPLTPQISRQLELPADTTGLVVTEVDPNGAAAAQGINRGDVIMEINRQPVTSLEEVKAALDKSGDKPILLLISRKGQTIYLTVKAN
ncbi:MAG: Do family serine endopeptidase [Acidobacteriota bacterium]|nr:Do family serine endopeptidase [Acidobacteriota bacterium]